MFKWMQKNQSSWCYKAHMLLLSFSFALLNLNGAQISYAQSSIVNQLPVPGTMVGTSQAYVPLLIKGMTLNLNNPFDFRFIIDSGHSDLPSEEIRSEAERLIHYFLAAMTIPKDDLWVNLSPYEKDRIIPPALGTTALGRDLLAQDYILKQLTASLMYPESEVGAAFWKRVRDKAREQFGTEELPMNTFNKVWILPERASVYERNQTVFIVDSRLKVMLDQDYLALDNNSYNSSLGMDQIKTAEQSDASSLSSQIIREIILPEIEWEVNEGQHFAPLRQIYHSLILAKWYKQNIQEGILARAFVDQKNVKDVQIDDSAFKEGIYQRYMEAYGSGVYNYIKEEYDVLSQQIVPRKYFSGGITDSAMSVENASERYARQRLNVSGDGALFNIGLALGNFKRGMPDIFKGLMIMPGWQDNQMSPLDFAKPDSEDLAELTRRQFGAVALAALCKACVGGDTSAEDTPDGGSRDLDGLFGRDSGIGADGTVSLEPVGNNNDGTDLDQNGIAQLKDFEDLPDVTTENVGDYLAALADQTLTIEDLNQDNYNQLVGDINASGNQDDFVDALIAALEQTDPAPFALKRQLIVRLLGDIGQVDGMVNATASARVHILLSNDPDPAVRAEAATVLGKFNQSQSVTPLENSALDDEDAGVRMASVQALGTYDDRAGIVNDFYSTLTSDESTSGQKVNAAFALGELDAIQHLSDLDGLVDIVNNGFDVAVRGAVAEALGKFESSLDQTDPGDGQSSEYNTVKTALFDSFFSIRASVTSQTTAEQRAVIDTSLQQVATAVSAFADSQITADLIATLNDVAGEPTARLVAAADFLGKLEDPAAVDVLIRAVERSDPANVGDVRRSAVQALGHYAEEKVVVALRKVVNNELITNSDNVRVTAIQSLGNIALPSAVTILEGVVTAIPSSGMALRIAAIQGVAASAGEGTVDFMVGIASNDKDVYTDFDNGVEVRNTAVQGLEDIGGLDAVNGLLEVAQASENANFNYAPVRQFAVEAVGRIIAADQRGLIYSMDDVDAILSTLEDIVFNDNGNDVRAAAQAAIDAINNRGDDSAMLEKVGGIDMNNIDIDKQGSGIQWNFAPDSVPADMVGQLDNIKPVIFNLTPIDSLTPILR